MKKLMAEITSKLQDQEIPPQGYSDLYISKENDSSFWVVAESLIGQFQKFNDNFYLFGYINPDQTLANHLAQCFSYIHITMWYEYMINDIQAVGYKILLILLQTLKKENFMILIKDQKEQSNVSKHYLNLKKILIQKIIRSIGS